MKTERTLIHSLSDVLVAASSLDLKVPILAGKCDCLRHFNTGFSVFSQNVLVAETSYQSIVSDRERA